MLFQISARLPIIVETILEPTLRGDGDVRSVTSGVSGAHVYVAALRLGPLQDFKTPIFAPITPNAAVSAMATDWYVQLLCYKYERSTMFATHSSSDAEAKRGARRQLSRIPVESSSPLSNDHS